MRPLRLTPADQLREGLGGHASKHAKFTWVTKQGKYERWIAASKGDYTVIWNVRR
jgi:hypothetical protein